MAAPGKCLSSMGLLLMLVLSTSSSSSSFVAAAAAAAAAAPSPDIHFFSFGDSYTATSFRANGTQPSASDPMGNPPLGRGTYAGGANYVGWLATRYRGNSTVLSYDLGYPGATVSNAVVPMAKGGTQTFEEQVTGIWRPVYGGRRGSLWTADSAVFSVFFGINDIGLPLTSEPHQLHPMNQTVPRLLDAYFALVGDLYDAGARRFLFINVPPLDRSPLITGMAGNRSAVYAGWVAEYNRQLAQRIEAFTSSPSTAGGSNTSSSTAGGSNTSSSTAGGSNASPSAVDDTSSDTSSDAVVSSSDTTPLAVATFDYNRWLGGVLDAPAAYGFPNATCVNHNGQECVWWNPYHVGSRLDDFLARRLLPAVQSLGWDGHAATGGHFS